MAGDSTVFEDFKGSKNRRMSDIQAISSFSDRPSSFTESQDENVCWICLDSSQVDLLKPCKCPRYSHSHCLARWQLQSAGSRREEFCEFCDSHLPNWKETLTPICGANAPAVMNVNFDGKTYSFEVKPGPDGYRQFTEAIRGAFNLPDDSELNITFTCDEPTTAPPSPGLGGTGSLITLQGAGAYDAAVHCASVSAARRIVQQNSPGGPATPRRSASPGSNLDSPSSSGSQASSSAGSPGGRDAKNKRLAGIGRKLRSAICEYFSPNKL